MKINVRMGSMLDVAVLMVLIFVFWNLRHLNFTPLYCSWSRCAHKAHNKLQTELGIWSSEIWRNHSLRHSLKGYLCSEPPGNSNYCNCSCFKTQSSFQGSFCHRGWWIHHPTRQSLQGGATCKTNLQPGRNVSILMVTIMYHLFLNFLGP